MIRLSVRWLKFCSFGFAKRWLACRAKPNVQNAGGFKIVLKIVRWEKIKTRVRLLCRLTSCRVKIWSAWCSPFNVFVYVLKFKFWPVVCHVQCRNRLAYNGQVLPMVENFIFVRPEPLLGFLIKLNIKN